MADLKISQLTGATTPLAGTEVLPIVQSGSTKKVSVANLTSGRSTGVLDLTINDSNAGANYTLGRNGATGFLKFYGNQTGFNGYTFSGVDGDLFEINNSGNLTPKGNLVVANGKGIDFSATPGTGTSELLADYEEGTWTGTLIGSTSAPTIPVTATGIYTKIGRQVTVGIAFNNVNTTGIVGNLQISGLPFTVGAQQRNYIGAATADSVCAITNPRTMAENSGVKLQFVEGNAFVAATANLGGFLWCSNTYFV